jgi:hypothetical protein
MGDSDLIELPASSSSDSTTGSVVAQFIPDAGNTGWGTFPAYGAVWFHMGPQVSVYGGISLSKHMSSTSSVSGVHGALWICPENFLLHFYFKIVS